MYIDGNERSHVGEYRKRFLERMGNYQKRVLVYSGENCEIIQFPEQRLLVMVEHEESCFS